MKREKKGRMNDMAEIAHNMAYTHPTRKTRNNFNLYVIIAITQKLFAIERTHTHTHSTTAIVVVVE